jgi:hypothetical protein
MELPHSRAIGGAAVARAMIDGIIAADPQG